ncbi:MAG: hypothetical protein AMXMBFR7_19200 [Planctomycetota bacterium]
MAQFRSRLTTDPGSRFEECMETAHRLLRKAADEWAIGDPEVPATEAILNDILRVFEKSKFLRRP